MAEGSGEASGFSSEASQSGFSQAPGMSEGYSSAAQQQQGSAGQDVEARQGIAALYSAIQALSQKMGTVDTLQERLSPLWEQKNQGPPPIDDYDATLRNMQERVDALAQLFQLDQQHRNEYIQKMAQQQYAEYQQKAQAWVDNAKNTVDSHLESCGYPGFAAHAPQVAAYIAQEFKQVAARYAPDSPQMKVVKHLANHPQFWADVYVQKIVPAMNEKAQRFSRMTERRQQSRYLPPQQLEYRGRHNFR